MCSSVCAVSVMWSCDRKLSENEEHRLAPNRVDKLPHSPRHSPAPQVSLRTVLVGVVSMVGVATGTNCQ